jgi:L-ascorbate metabolism protein UlaG (beta-lactamase superfamily)
VVTATEFVPEGVSVQGIDIQVIPAQESLIHKEVVGDNALYRFELDGIVISHMGDVGNPLSDNQLDALKGTDVLFALVGGPPTIELPDLHYAIDVICPKIVIPMHYRIPGPEFFILPVTDFLDHYPEEKAQRVGDHTIEINKSTLPSEMKIMVMEPALAGNK